MNNAARGGTALGSGREAATVVTTKETVESIIRDVLARHGRLPVAIETVAATDDLYGLGLTSFASVDVMLALEEAFDVEFPSHMLRKGSLASITAIKQSVKEALAA